jgi:hypothetical protein
MSRSGLLLALLLFAISAQPAAAREAKPKLGPDAVPIMERTEYLRITPAPDYWRLSPFYVPQQTASACSLASITMALNFVRGLPRQAEEAIVTQPAVLTKLGDATWAEEVAEGGSGVTFDEFVTIVKRSLAAYQLQDHHVEVIRPMDDTTGTLARVRQALMANEADAGDIILVYFNQGVLTGDWDGPHISPIGAYDKEARQVLIMDVDREWYVPYWTTDTQLLAAMLRPTSAEHGRLAGETGGLIWIKSPVRWAADARVARGAKATLSPALT